MKKELKPYVALCDAIGKLFYPNVEVVMHDLASQKLVHIVNAFSKRRVGDAMLSDVKAMQNLHDDFVGPYEKRNPDGKRLKSVSVIVRDVEGTPIGMICINYNTEAIHGLFDALKGFLHVNEVTPKPSILFSQSWQEHTDEIIGKYLSAKNISLSGLSVEDKKALIHYLDTEGIFAIRNVVVYVCSILNISKATLYNWLKAVRNENT